MSKLDKFWTPLAQLAKLIRHTIVTSDIRYNETFISFYLMFSDKGVIQNDVVTK